MKNLVSKARRLPVVPWVVFALLTGAAVLGFNISVMQADRHPVMFALALSWLIVAFVSAVSGPVFLRLDPKQVRCARWEREGRIYEWLGVGAFRWLLLHTPLGRLNTNVYLRSGRSDMERLLREMNYAEGAHAVAGLLSLVVAAGCGWSGNMAAAIWMVLVNVPLNLYPVLLQRWNRGRIGRMQRRLAGCRPGSSNSGPVAG